MPDIVALNPVSLVPIVGHNENYLERRAFALDVYALSDRERSQLEYEIHHFAKVNGFKRIAVDEDYRTRELVIRMWKCPKSQA